MVPEKFRIRDDAKWGHPELEMAYSLMGQSVGYSEVLLKDDLSFEERQEFAAHAEDGFKDYLPIMTGLALRSMRQRAVLMSLTLLQ